MKKVIKYTAIIASYDVNGERKRQTAEKKDSYILTM